MSSKQAVRCGIYGNRPKFCQDYPTINDVRPGACTYKFRGEEREGTCQPEVCQEQACCLWPRKFGEPDAEAATHAEGGRPCKHVVWQDVVEPKQASDVATYDAGEINSAIFADLNKREY